MAERLRLDVDLSINQDKLNSETRNIIRKARALDRAFNKIDPKGISKVNKALRSSATSMQALEDGAKRSGRVMGDLGQKAGLTAQRFIIYNVIAGFFFKLTGAITEGIGAFVKFNAALNRAEQILNPLTSDMNQLKNAVFDLANTYGVTIEAVQQAQETFIRQGVSLATAIKLTKASLALASAAAVDAAQATETLTSVIRQFNISMKNATSIVDKFVAVSINFAVTAQDIDEGIRRAGAAAATVGVQFEELVGFITAAQEATRRGGRVIGTGLRTIFTRIFRAPAIKALEELGIQTRETTGEFRRASSILTDLAGKFQTLNRTQQIAIASTISGQRQIATLLALLRNWQRGIEATNTALTAQGTAADLTRKRQESLEVQIQRIVNQFTRFGTAIGSIVSSDAIAFIQVFSNSAESLGKAFEGLDSGPLRGMIDTLAKVGVLVGLQTIGVGKLTAKIGLGTKLLANEATIRTRIAKLTKEGALASSLRSRNGKLIRVSVDAETQALIKQGKINQQTTQLAKLQREETVSQASVQTLLFKIEKDRLVIKKAELELTAANLRLKVLETKQSAALTKQEKEIARIAARRAKIKVTRNTEALERRQLKQIDEEIAAIRATSNERSINAGKSRENSARKVLKLAKDIDKLRNQSKAVQSGKLKGGQERLDKITFDLRAKEGELARRNAVLRKKGSQAEVEANKQILNLQSKALKLTEKREQRSRDLANLRRDSARSLRASNAATIAVDKERTSITAQIAANETATANALNNVTNNALKANKLRTNSLSRVRQIADLTKKIGENQKALNGQLKKQQETLTRGRKGIGIAFGVSLGVDLLANQLRDLGEEGSKSFKIAADAAEGFGGALTTLAIASGPLGLVLFGIQAIITTSKLLNQIGPDATESLSKSRAALKQVNNETRALATAFSTLESKARKASLGKSLSVDDFAAIDEQMTQVAKATGIARAELSTFRNEIGKAVSKGDIDRIRELRKEMLRFTTLRGIATGKILNSKDIKGAIDALEQGRVQVRKAKKDINDIQSGKHGLFDSPLRTIAEATGQLNVLVDKGTVKVRTATEALNTFADEGVKAFSAIVDPALSLDENLKLLGKDAESLLRRNKRLGELADILSTARGHVPSRDNAEIAAKQTKDESEALQNLQKDYKKTGGDLRSLDSILQGYNRTQDRFVEVGGKFKNGFVDSPQFEQLVTFIAKLRGVSKEAIRDALLRDLNDVNSTLVVTRTETGGTSVNFKTLGKTIFLATGEGAEFNKITKGMIKFTSLSAKEQQKLAATIVSNTIILQSYEERLSQVTNIIKGTTDTYKALTKETLANAKGSKLLAQAFPAKAFRDTADAGDVLVAASQRANTNLRGLLKTFDAINNIAHASALVVGDDIRIAMEKGAKGAVLFNARIHASLDGLKQAEVLGKRFVKQQEELKKSTKGAQLGFADRELSNQVKQRLVAEKLSQALIGLFAIRDKFITAPKGAGFLKEDRKSASEFLDVIDKIVGLDTSGLRGTLKFDSSKRQEMIDGILNLMNSLGQAATKIEDPIIREAVTSLVTGIQESINKAVSAGGKSTTTTLSNALIRDVVRAKESAIRVTSDFIESVRGLNNASLEELDAAVNISKNKIDELTKVISKGSFVPDFSGQDIKIVERHFARIRASVKVQKERLQQELKGVKLDISTTEQEIATLNKSGLEKGNNQKKFEQAQAKLTKLKSQESLFEEKIKHSKQDEANITNQFVLLVAASIGQVGKAQKELFATQDKFLQSSIAVAEKRSQFNLLEASSIEERVALIQAERRQVEETFAKITGFGDGLDVNKIAQKITELTNKLIEGRQRGISTAAAAALQIEIDSEKRKFTLVDEINKKRIGSLEKERQLINDQKKAVEGFASEFLKANDSQQKNIIESSRVVDKFFGSLTPQSVESPEFTRQAAKFLRQTNDEMRNAVITQLERLKNIGGEVAPGVSAEKVLQSLTQGVVGALFKSPMQRTLEQSKSIQERILAVSKDSNIIAETSAKLAIQRQNQNTRSVNALISTTAHGGVDTNKETQKQAQQVQAQMAGGLKEISAINSARAVSEQKLAIAAQAATIKNKDFIDQFQNISTAASNTNQPLEAFQKEMVGLRNTLVQAEDKVINSEQSFRDALGNVGDALLAVSVAQAQFALGIDLAQRESIKAVGQFTTFRDELSFLDKAFEQQIISLQRVGATEIQIAELRSRLAQEQLSVIEAQIGKITSAADALLTSDSGIGFFQAGQAGGIAASIANDIGIKPGETPSRGDQQAFADAILSLPLQIRNSLKQFFDQAPPGTTVGGFGPQELQNITRSALGGASDATPDLVTLQKEAATRREIIAQNSISSLISARQGVITAQSQLTTAQEQLTEARAQKDLAQMNLDSAAAGFENNNRAIDAVAANLTTNTKTIQTESDKQIQQMIKLGETIVLNSRATAQDFKNADNATINAAGGTLTGAEVAGLLRAASREKSAMPSSAGLGVFNTSETVLTRKQMARLNNGNVPNAAGGTAIVGSNEITALLEQISGRLLELKQRDIKQQITVDIDSNRRVNIEGLAGLQTALQDIVGDRTGDLYTREEAKALEELVRTILTTLRETGQVSAIGT